MTKTKSPQKSPTSKPRPTRKVGQPPALTKEPVTKAAQMAAQQAAVPPRHQRRVGSSLAPEVGTSTFADRLVKRRLELGLTQAQVASRVKIIVRSPGAETLRNTKKSHPDQVRKDEAGNEYVVRPLKRAAYGMYEAGSHLPDLDRVKELAQALETSVIWLAFDVDDSEIQKVWVFDDEAGKFVETEETWRIAADWATKEDHVGVYLMDVICGPYQPNDAVIFSHVDEVSAGLAQYLFHHKGMTLIADAHAGPKNSLRYYNADRSSFTDVPMSEVEIAGRVIGKVTQA